MIKCLLKIKLNDYFPKIDAIPYNNYICLLKYNNFISKIIISERNNQLFIHKITIMNKADLLLNIQLIDYLNNNSLIGSCDLLIPYTKFNQLLKNRILSYHQQIQLRINQDYNIQKNISNIYLDLIIEITKLETNISSKKNENNKYEILNYKQKNLNRNILNINNKNLFKTYEYNKNNYIQKINISKSPLLPKAQQLYNNEHNKTYIKYDNTDNNYDNKYLDINYNVINNNYLNYINADNNNYFIDYNNKNPKHNIPIGPSKLYKIRNNTKIGKYNSFINNNEIKYYNFDENSEYLQNRPNINQNYVKAFCISDNLNENMNNVENKNSSIKYNNNKKDYLNTINRNNISYFKKEINIDDDINNKDSILYNKKYIQKYINKRIKDRMSCSPIYNKNNKSREKSPFVIPNKFDEIQIYEKNNDNISISKNSKKNKEIKISSVLHYFNHVKPFVRKSVKSIKNTYKNLLNKFNNEDKKISSENLDKIKINNNEIPQNLNQNDLKESIIKYITDNAITTQNIKQKIKLNKKLIKKYFLCKEKYYTELKKQNLLISKVNNKQIKFEIHVNINSKLNEKLYLNMKKIKKEEFSIYENIFQDNKKNQAKKKIQEKLEQQKKCLILIKIIRELINNYDNLSQLYNDDENKKILFKSLLLRYGIREKEENKEKNLLEKYNELKQSIKNEKNKKLISAKKKEMEKDMYKNVINEEASEEGGSSISGRKSKPNNIFKKLSWCSEDSIIKEKEFFEKNNENIDEENDSANSQNILEIKEEKNDLKKEDENNNNKEKE